MASPGRGKPGAGPGGVLQVLAAFVVMLGVGRIAGFLRERLGLAGQGKAERDAAEAEQARARGYEPSDVPVRPLVWVGVGAVVFSVACGVGLDLLVGYVAARPAAPNPLAPAFSAPTEQPPAPRLQVDPQADWAGYRATEEALLDSYGRDPSSGAIHIPIERAMDLVVERGLREGATPQPAAGPTPTAGP